MIRYMLYYTDKDGFLVPYEPEGIAEVYKTRRLAQDMLLEISCDLQKQLNPEPNIKKTWIKKTVVQTYNLLPDYKRVLYRRIVNTLEVKKVKIL